MKQDNSFLSLRPNERLLLRLIRQYSPSRTTLSQLSGLTAGAITQYCRKLQFLGLIKENEQAVKKRGQASYHLTLNPTACCSIGIAFFQEYFQLVVVDFCGNKLASSHHAYQSIHDIKLLLIQLHSSIHQLLKKKFLTSARILGVGISVSGYQLEDGSYSSPWFPLLKEQPNLCALFSEALELPCWIENNINTIAIGEYYSGNWNNVNDIVVISLGFGIGAGTISQGKLIRGNFGNAGEVGLLYPYGQARPTWSDLVSTLKDSYLNESTLAKLANKQNSPLKQWLEQAKPQVLLLITSAIAWLDPKVIVVTGMLPKILVEEMLDYVKSSSIITQINRPIAQFSAVQITTENITLGSALIPIYHLLQEAK